MNLILTIRDHVKNALRGSHASHDWDHTRRVTNLALHIAHKEQANATIVHLAALLHDIARQREDQQQGKVCHAQVGAQEAAQLLTGYHLPSKQIDQVCHCIAAHRFRSQVKPQSLEACVLFDADKLDALGAVGIGRAFLFAGGIGAKLHNSDIDIAQTKAYTIEDTAYREYMLKLRHIKKSMLTKEGQRMATKRHEFMDVFFNRLDQETTGLL